MTTPFAAVLVGFLAACVSFALFAPQALTSSALASRTGLCLGLGGGLGLLLLSRSNALEAGAMAFIVPVQFLTFVIAPVIVACIARSLRAAVQTIVAGLFFGGVMMFPVCIDTNLGDAISWLLLVVPGLMIPMGIIGAALATVVARATGRAVHRISSDEAAAGSAGTGRTSGS